MSDDKKTSGSYIGQAWLVILLALLYGAALAGVQVGLSDRIAENKRNKIYNRIPILVPGAVQEATVEQTITVNGGDDWLVYQTFGSEGQHLGWVIPAEGMGFADAIGVLIGTSADLETIYGISILYQKETPGLGDNITKPAFTEEYADKPAMRQLEVVKLNPSAHNQILAVTGATVSSVAVTGIVNNALARTREPLASFSMTGETSP